MLNKILNIDLVRSKGMKIPRIVPDPLPLALFDSACSNGKVKNSTPAPSVIVGFLTKKTVPVEIRAVGNARAHESLENTPTGCRNRTNP